jgi:hypothetical protein
MAAAAISLPDPLPTECQRGAMNPTLARLRADAQVRFARAHLAYSTARGKDAQ